MRFPMSLPPTLERYVVAGCALAAAGVLLLWACGLARPRTPLAAAPGSGPMIVSGSLHGHPGTTSLSGTMNLAAWKICPTPEETQTGRGWIPPQSPFPGNTLRPYGANELTLVDGERRVRVDAAFLADMSEGLFAYRSREQQLPRTSAAGEVPECTIAQGTVVEISGCMHDNMILPCDDGCDIIAAGPIVGAERVTAFSRVAVCKRRHSPILLVISLGLALSSAAVLAVRGRRIRGRG